ncbi:MAG: U32 family peptidase [Desulfovibrionaceae bacterium]|nr:U32 family peptidase [Desulfovibrionaceae bacterium]
MTQSTDTPRRPEILAPAGDESCFLAALAAGADAIYLGLKQFSARMQADNFGTVELARLVELAHAEHARVHVAMNTLVKPGELQSAYNLVKRLARDVQPDALIVQDLSFLDVARQAGFTGELHLSTLSNATHPAAMNAALELGASRIVLPRELSIDEIRFMGEACPDGLDLECFIHGALCYCVSGRCYWSSYMGGKSGLRGRCVQPCRRIYKQGGSIAAAAAAKYESPEEKQQRQREAARRQYLERTGRAPREARPRQEARPRGREHAGRYFSCMDLSLDVLAKTLTDVPHLNSWKIEGRKKGPHYVYHVVTAYRILRDSPHDPQARKMAEGILDMALGRPVTRARFLPQCEGGVTAPDGQTSSGLLVGKVSMDQNGRPCIKPHIELLPQDYLRVGVEDERWHSTLPVTRRTPKAGTLQLRVPVHKTPRAGTAVYLIDRREPQLLRILTEWQQRLSRTRRRESRPVDGQVLMPAPAGRSSRLPDMALRSSLPQGRETRGGRGSLMGLWLSPRTVQGISRTVMPRVAWWLPPVVWPQEEEGLARALRQLWQNGARHFVCNDPWQARLVPEGEGRQLVAGPFCNIANGSMLGQLRKLGFTAAVVSPELAGEDYLALPRQSPLPLGIVLDGFWPVGISRFGMNGVKANEPFVSPRGEIFWARQYGGNVWLYPGWPLNLTEKRPDLEAAGYSFFVHIQETVPPGLPELRRNGLFNWEGALL